MHSSRKCPIHLPIRYKGNRSVLIFVTICTKSRLACLLSEEGHRVICRAWAEATHYRVGKYLIMPDHVHFFCSPATYPAETMKPWVEYFKSRTAQNWPMPLPHKLWQRGYWDTQIFTHEQYRSKWAYVQNNPVRANLIDRAEEWKFTGEMYSLQWHD